MVLEQEQRKSKEANVNFLANFVMSAERALVSGEAVVDMHGWIPNDLADLVKKSDLFKGEYHMALATQTLRIVAEQMPQYKRLRIVSRESNDGQDTEYCLRGVDFRFGESVAEEVWKNKRTASGERVK